jgi:hypothetical protein
MKLTDTLDDQILLEQIIEATKPPAPPDCADLDFLLMTPFRYSPRNPWGSRFRRPFADHGVFYASERPRTAVAETIFHRLLFFADSPATPWPQNAGEYTAFAVELASQRAIDLAGLPEQERDAILATDDYTMGQGFGDVARAAGIEAIKYPSVRDPDRGTNVAVLSPTAFAAKAPVDRQTWRIHLDANGARAFCEAPRKTLALGRHAFDTDRRMIGFIWDR